MSYATSAVVITGASRGIGRYIAKAFASETNRPLILVARSENELLETKRLCVEAGVANVAVIPCDLTDLSQVERLSLPDNMATPGIIINNAGAYLYKPLSATTSREFLDQIQTNLFSAVHITNRFLDGLKKLDRGLIINICSVGAIEGLEDSGAYSSSKHALLGYTRSLRKELMETNIAVTAINLGQTQSASWESSRIAPDLLIDPYDVAALLVSLTNFSGRTVAEEIILKPQHGRVPPV